jgi:hypothetical protein
VPQATSPLPTTGPAAAPGSADWGNFRQASASAAARITPILDHAAQALVVALDAPFFGLAPLLPARHAARIVNVARATAALHAPGDHERVTWERDSLLATPRARDVNDPRRGWHPTAADEVSLAKVARNVIHCWPVP